MGSRIRMDSFDIRRLDPNKVCKFNITQARKGHAKLFGYVSKRIVVLHLNELTMNIVDKKNPSKSVKSYRTDVITRIHADEKDKLNVSVHMQRDNSEIVKQYLFGTAEASKTFISMVNTMNSYGPVLNHVYEEHCVKTAKEGIFSYKDLCEAIRKYVHFVVDPSLLVDLAGPENASLASITLRQLFHVIAAAEDESEGRVCATPSQHLSSHHTDDNRSLMANGTDASSAKKKSSSVMSRINNVANLRERESNGGTIDILHNRCSLQWQRLADGVVSRVFVSGRLVLTNFRLMFVARSKHVRQRRMSLYMNSAFMVSMPLTSVVSITVDKISVGMKLSLKDLRTVHIKFNDTAQNVSHIARHIREKLYFHHDLDGDTASKRLTLRSYIERVFAFSKSKDSIESGAFKGWQRFGNMDNADDPQSLTWLQKEYRRLGLISRTAKKADSPMIPGRGKWREYLNQKLSTIPTYPQYIVIPSKTYFPDHELYQAFEFRSKRRIPAVTWRDPTNGTVMMRSSQPLVGVAGNHDVADEKLLDLYRRLGTTMRDSDDAQIAIVDCRALIAARGNYARGGGFENMNRYKNCEMRFLNIDNIHAMRSSITKVAMLCATNVVQSSGMEEGGDEDWLVNLSATKWLRHVHRVLAGSVAVARMLHVENKSVLVHCSDGWDRTSQVCALAELILDPHYRTLKGFATLVQKDWCAFGHKFHDRIGHGQEPELNDDAAQFFATKECSPVFLQFVECVWQILRQIPNAFEFNKEYLLFLVDAVYSCEFGNFLCNNERERDMLNLASSTYSVWDHIDTWKFMFVNENYEREEQAIWPSSSLRHLVFWEDFFFRFDPCCFRSSGETPCIPTPAVPSGDVDDSEDDDAVSSKQDVAADVEMTSPPGLADKKREADPRQQA